MQRSLMEIGMRRLSKRWSAIERSGVKDLKSKVA